MLFALSSTRLHPRLLQLVFAATALGGTIALPQVAPVWAQARGDGQALTLRADQQEANAITGVVTARGNVQINYPARRIQATAVQGQYYSREGRIVLSGDVYVLQDGNSLRADTITYLVNEGRFVATPETGQQVESIYIVPDANAPVEAAPTAEAEPDFNPKPELKTPISPPEGEVESL